MTEDIASYSSFVPGTEAKENLGESAVFILLKRLRIKALETLVY